MPGPQLPGLGAQGGRKRNTLANMQSHEKVTFGGGGGLSALPPLDPASTANYYQQLEGLYAQYQGQLDALRAQRVGIRAGARAAIAGFKEEQATGIVNAESEAIGRGMLGSSVDAQNRIDVRAEAAGAIAGVRAEQHQALAQTRLAAQGAAVDFFQASTALEAQKLAQQQSLLASQLEQNLIISGQEMQMDMMRQMYESQLGGKGISANGNAVIAAAMKQIGAPYDEIPGSNAFGSINPFGPAGGPGAAFDCSGLTKYAVAQATNGRINLPHSAEAQQGVLPRVGRSQLQPGDLLFFNYGRKGPGVADHVAIYIGNGKMIDASSSSRPLGVRGIDWSHFLHGGAVRVGGNSSAKGGGSKQQR